MSKEPPRPGESGYLQGVFTSYALDVGLKLAGKIGTGLQLFNALRKRFGGVAQSILGSITSTLGEGIRAATGLTADEMTQPVNPSSLPIVPADFHPGEGGDRIVGQVMLSLRNVDTDQPEFRLVWVNSLEVMTPADLIEEAKRLFALAQQAANSKDAALLVHEAQELLFLATRY